MAVGLASHGFSLEKDGGVDGTRTRNLHSDSVVP